MIVGDFVEDYEVMVPFQTLLTVGNEVHAVVRTRNRANLSPLRFTILKVIKRIAKSGAPVSAQCII
jgi:putative intracellular protease/amidase